MAEKIAKKINESYEKVIDAIRCKLSFIILKCSTLHKRESWLRFERYWWIFFGFWQLEVVRGSPGQISLLIIFKACVRYFLKIHYTFDLIT